MGTTPLPPFPRIYFRTPYGRQRRWAFGCRDELFDLSSANQISHPDADPAIYAFSAFDPAGSPPKDKDKNEWEGWPRRCYFRPHYEIVMDQNKTNVTIRPSHFDPDEILSTHSSFLRCPDQDPSVAFKAISINEGQVSCDLQWAHLPDRNDWHKIYEAAMRSIERDIFTKVVLCRRTALSLGKQPDPWFLVHALDCLQPEGYLFLIEWNERTAFLGVSPERLYERHGCVITTEAVAGTRADEIVRSGTMPVTPTLKETREHEDVVRMIDASLHVLCDSYKRSQTPVLKPHGATHHFKTEFQGRLHEDVTDEDIIRTLHPTPAVCGWPTEKARQFIQKHEPFDRGCYTGWFGLVDNNEALFSVNLRCCLLKESSVFVYAGAGLVMGSHPRMEWEEMDQKIDFWKPILTQPTLISTRL